MREFTLFDSAIGHCGIAWDGETILGVALPEDRVEDTRGRVQERFGCVTVGDPPASVRHAINEMVASLRGEPNDLEGIALDLAIVPPFHRRVYEVVRTIAPGETMSYGEVAIEVGSPGAARAVGQALGRNPFAIIVPCHRVLAAGGKIGGFTANGGVSTKLRMLAVEGVQTEDAGTSGQARRP